MRKRTFIAILAVLTAVLFAGSAFAASVSLKIDRFTYDPDIQSDVMGEAGSIKTDGKPDMGFRFSVSGAQAIKNVTVTQKETGKIWSASPNSGQGLLVVTDSSGTVLNESKSFPLTPVLLMADFRAYIGDAETAFEKDSTLELSLTLVDNKVVKAETQVKGTGKVADKDKKDEKDEKKGVSDGKDGIKFAEFFPKSEFDVVGTGEKISADGKPDARIDLGIEFKDAVINGIKVKSSVGGKSASWDTISGNNIPIVAVVDKNENILNKTNGSVSIAVKGGTKLMLLVQDNNIMPQANSKVTVTVTTADGRVYENSAKRGKVVLDKDTMAVDFKGKGRFDFVGENEKLSSNLNPDNQITAEINSVGTVSGVKVKASNGKVWDTVANNNNWLVAVTDEKNERLNKQDGTVSFKLDGPTKLNLWFEEESGADAPYTVTFVFTNGRAIVANTKETAKPAPKKPAATEPKPSGEIRDVKFISIKPQLINVDIVGKNKKRAANGAKDTMLKIRVTGDGTITAITVKDQWSGGWDTFDSNNGRWLLGVRENTKLLNAADGTVKIPVNGVKTLQLFMQDNGKLRANKGKFIVVVNWSDGEVSENIIEW